VRDVGDVDADFVDSVTERAPRERVVVIASVFGIDSEDQMIAQVGAVANLGRRGWMETRGFGDHLGWKVDAQAILRGHRVIVPLGAVVGAEDLDEARDAVIVDLGNAVVAVFGGRATLPDQRHAAGSDAA
jgi:hypothetical protein